MNVMTLAAWLLDAEKRLARILKDAELAHQDAHWLAAKALDKDRAWIAAYGHIELTLLNRWNLDRLLRRRLKEEPLAYILGTAPFYGRNFLVDKRVLIPRPETEDLVELALRRMSNIEKPVVIDIGTGSGAIASTIALDRRDAIVFASDASTRALTIAKKNAEHLGANVRFSKGHLLHSKLVEHLPKKKPLFLLANLPYLPVSDKRKMPKSVTRYEPSSALFANDDGMDLNKKLLAQIPKNMMRDKCCVLMELDPPQAQTLQSFARTLFPKATIRVHPDRCGRDRILEIET